MVLGRPQKCERIRGSISAELDGELSELESLSVRSHISRCASCRSFMVDAETISTALRATPLEPLSRPVALPSRRRHVLPMRAPAAAAAAALLMIVSGGIFESLHSGAVFGGNPSTEPVFDNRLDERALARRNQAANFAKQLALRAQVEASRIPRRPGPQGS